MKAQILVLFTLFFSFFGCSKPEVNENESFTEISKNVAFKLDNQTFYLKSGKFNYEFRKSELPLKKVVLLNASLVGYFTALNQESKIAGISSPEYIFSPKIRELISQNIIAEVGNEQKYNVEKIISLKPDAVFTNYIATFANTYQLLEQNGIKVIFLDEYLEQNPLEKSRYLIVFGKLLGAEKLAETRYREIEQNYRLYAAAAKAKDPKPLVLANEMYGNQWYLPGGRSALSQFVKDAGGNYILAEDKGAQAKLMSFEEVFVKGQKAEIWVNVGNHKSKKQLLQANPNYRKLPVFNNGKLYALTAKESGKANDFFESGTVRADLVLKDYIAIFHPAIFPEHTLTYLQVLK